MTWGLHIAAVAPQLSKFERTPVSILSRQARAPPSRSQPVIHSQGTYYLPGVQRKHPAGGPISPVGQVAYHSVAHCRCVRPIMPTRRRALRLEDTVMRQFTLLLRNRFAFLQLDKLPVGVQEFLGGKSRHEAIAASSAVEEAAPRVAVSAVRIVELRRLRRRVPSDLLCMLATARRLIMARTTRRVKLRPVKTRCTSESEWMSLGGLARARLGRPNRTVRRLSAWGIPIMPEEQSAALDDASPTFARSWPRSARCAPVH